MVPTTLWRTLGVAAALILTSPALAEEQIVNVYSYRESGLIQPLIDRFEAETGIKAVMLFSDAGLMERVAAEGENSPADLILTVDIGNLESAKSLGIAQKLGNDTVAAKVPAAYRDGDDEWTALSLRARVFYASVDRVSETALSYDDIAKPDWKGRLCTRSGQHAYNIGLIADYITHHGPDKARTWLAGVRDNLIGRPTGNDRAQVKEIYSGACDLAIGNTYYMGLMQTSTDEPEQQEWAKSARIIFPTDGEFGTHVNVAGVVLAKYAPHRENAEKLIDFLLSEEGQALYALGNFEYPVVPGVAASPIVTEWGDFTRDPTPLSEIAANRDAASALVDELGFDRGPQN